jgi:antitoxin component HigA of HigAB toxin-antitoxin module
MADVRPIRTEDDYDAALLEVERLWDAKLGTPEGDRLDVLATLIDSYEQTHHPMDQRTDRGHQVQNEPAEADAQTTRADDRDENAGRRSSQPPT